MKYLKVTLLLLFILFLNSCGKNYPFHKVIEGNKPMIIYKTEISNKPEIGKYIYAVSDNTSKGWTLYSNNKFTVGDTLHISNKK